MPFTTPLEITEDTHMLIMMPTFQDLSNDGSPSDMAVTFLTLNFSVASPRSRNSPSSFSDGSSKAGGDARLNLLAEGCRQNVNEKQR